MTPPPTDDLGALLRAADPDTHGGYIPDDGFTARTMARLPAPRAGLRGLVLAGAGALATLIALVAGAQPDAGLAELLGRATSLLSGEGWLFDLEQRPGLASFGVFVGLLVAAIALAVARDELT